MSEIAVRIADPQTLPALVASVAELFSEDAGRYDRLRDLTWPRRGGPANAGAQRFYQRHGFTPHAVTLRAPTPA